LANSIAPDRVSVKSFETGCLIVSDTMIVEKNANYATANTAIPFELTRTNVGNAMNPSTGVFTTYQDRENIFSLFQESILELL
jgi:hypothetical protein